MSKLRLSTTASLASKLMRRSSRVLTTVEGRFHSLSRTETDCFDNCATLGGGGLRDEPFVSTGDEVDAMGGDVDRTGLRAEIEDAGVWFDGRRGSVLVSREFTGFLRGEPGPSFLRKWPAVEVRGLVGGDVV